MSDYYQVLGVSRDASEDEIKRAYRRLAVEHHPDKNNGDKVSEERFKEVTKAYEVLRDPEKRRVYDTYGSEDPRMGGAGQDFFGGGFGEVFESLFGQAFGSPFANTGPRRGGNAEVGVLITFEEAIFGASKEISVRLPVMCGSCSGSGAEPGTQSQTCPVCKGVGQVRKIQQSFLGRVVTTSACDRCRGEGRIIASPCKVCRGEGIAVEDRGFVIEVPAGVDEGTTLRLAGKGPAATRGGVPGDLYVRISVTPSDRFVRDGTNLRATQQISFAQAVLGTVIEFESLDGVERLDVAAGTQSGDVQTIKGKGVPQLQGRRRGDLLIELVVVTPTDLSEEETDLIRQLAVLRGESVGEHGDHGIFSKLRSAWK